MKTLDIQGHRGCRGLYPENSLPAFKEALELGVHTLEFDVVISKDHKVIVSHEPFMNHEICLVPSGDRIEKDDEENHSIVHLSYEEIKNYDCGSQYFEKFPDQVKVKTYKPELKEVVDLAEEMNPNILYNIEIKRRKEWDNKHHPPFDQFADLVISAINEAGIMQKTTVQCFDIETLQYLNCKYPTVRLVYLIANEDTPELNLEKLGFTPFVYSPYYKLVNAELVNYCTSNNMQLIPWTINEVEEMKALISLGVDGIITDYPDRLINLQKLTK